jgi:hypothetical protein
LLALNALSFLLVVPAIGIGLAYGVSKLVCGSSETTQKTDEKAQEILKTQAAEPQPEEKITRKLPDWLAKRLEGIPVKRYAGNSRWDKTEEVMGTLPKCWVKSDQSETLHMKLEASYIGGPTFEELPPKDSRYPNSAKDLIPLSIGFSPTDYYGEHGNFLIKGGHCNHRGDTYNIQQILTAPSSLSKISEAEADKLSKLPSEVDLSDPKLKLNWMLVRLLEGKDIIVKELQGDGYWAIQFAKKK